MVSKNTTCSKKQVSQPGQAFTSIAVSFLVATPLVLSTAFAPAQAHDDHTDHDDTEYFIGLDNFEFLTGGTYTGLENPNYNRLSLLYAHRGSNPHFHGIGVYSYLGPVDNPTITSTNLNNRIPEINSGILPLQLLPGKGVYAGRLVSTDTHEEYSNLKIEPIASLENSSAEDQVLFNSSNQRWQSSLAGADISLQLAAISSGLKIGDSEGNDLFNSVGDTYKIGSGDNFSFTPVFSTDAAAPLGTYSATFKLVSSDNSVFQDSGTFSFDFRVAKVPEPSTTIGFSLVGLLAFSVSQRKKRSRSSLN